MATEQNNGLSVLAFAGAQLAFALNEVAGVQRTSMIEDGDDTLPHTLGSIVHAGRRWPVFGLGSDYELLAELPAERSYCVCLSADNGETGLALACETINAIPLAPGAELAAAPVCAQRPDSPMHSWHLQNERIIAVSSVPVLAHYIRDLMEKRDG